MSSFFLGKTIISFDDMILQISIFQVENFRIDKSDDDDH